MTIIYIFDIENKKEDYAKAFQFVIEGSCGDSKWALDNHIIEHSVENPIQAMNPAELYKDIVKLVEKDINSQTGLFEPEKIKCVYNRTFNTNCYYYFRIRQNPKDDVSNLHYYLLGRDMIQKNILECDNKSHDSHFFIAIDIAGNEEDRYRISRFLAGEHFKNKTTVPKAKIEHNIAGRQSPFRLRLVPNNNWIEDVFILTKTEDKVSFRVDSLNRVDLKPSHTFFSPFFLNEKNLYCLSQNVDFMFGLIRPKRNSPLISADLLYALAVASKADLDSLTENTIESKIADGETLTLDSQNFLIVSLREYCSACFAAIAEEAKLNLPEKNKEFIAHVKEFIETNTSRFSVLSFCIFLSFVSYMISPPKKSNRYLDFDVDAVAMDAEDYADGLLQIIENAVVHAGGGYFCFRVHKADKSDGIVLKRLDKYQLNLENDYYLEFMVSDSNLSDDITSKFFKNIKNNRNDYDISDIELQNMEEDFTLDYFFNYQRDEKKHWVKYYSKPKNIILHYGLLVFENLVRFAQGGFLVVSSNHFTAIGQNQFSNKRIADTTKWHLPGTQYEILLPLTYIKKQYATGLNAQLDYNTLNLEFHHFNIPTTALTKLSDEAISQEIEAYLNSAVNTKEYSSLKNLFIKDISDTIKSSVIICERTIDKKTIITIDASIINNPLSAEVFSKSFINMLYLEPLKKARYFAIQNASDTLLTTFSRIFSLLYMKTGRNSVMGGRQVYICSPHAEKEYMFFEESIKKSIVASTALASVKGMYFRELIILNRTAEKCNEKKPRNRPLILPFDVLLNDLFAKKIRADLERSIQEKPFGCCLRDVHMRVGSKIHIHGNYYEASLLFSFSNYISRFAFILSNKIIAKLSNINITNPDVTNKYVLVGYESYSESLMINLMAMLNAYYETDLFTYTIYYEENRKEPLSNWEAIQLITEPLFFIVVPIGSTLTTHDKVIADLARKMGKNVKELEINSIVGNYAVIVIRTTGEENHATGLRGIESDFWQKVILKANGGFIEYKLDENEVRNIEIITAVDSQWMLPGKCSVCFPKQSNPLKEEPLIQSNRASVVPMTMYGLTDDDLPRNPINSGLNISEMDKRLQFLKDGLCYGHIVRDNDNHFEYYFQTDKIMNSINDYEEKRELTEKEDYKSMKSWLEGVRARLINKESTVNEGVYNFIVAPLHKTNAEFVHAVNKTAFGHAQQIIWLDIKREYRDNVTAKYSNLTTLFNNLINAGKKADIHFHFVDDTITSGFTINRAKSILHTLFSETEYNCMNPLSESRVKVHLFSSIILLLNRCSDSTMSTYISGGNHFNFIRLNISAMRSYSDACVPCKNLSDYSIILQNAATTNMLSGMFLIQARKYERRNAENINAKTDTLPLHIQDKKLENNEDIAIYSDRYYFRMLATHRFNSLFGKLGSDKNDKEKIMDCILGEINRICENSNFDIAYDQFFSTLKVLSKPFLSSRHSVLKATTTVLLGITSFFLNGIVPQDCLITESTEKFIFDIKKADKKQHQEFLMLLFSCLTNVNSTYPVRYFTIETFFKYCRDHGFVPDDLIPRYVMYVKRLLSISGRESLSVWLERLINEGQEPYPPRGKYERLNNTFTGITQFLNHLQLENTAPICDALDECYKAWERIAYNDSKLEDLTNYTLAQYYCKTYCDYVEVNNCCDNSVFTTMLKLYHHLKQPETRNVDTATETYYYAKMIQYIKDILKVKTAILYLKPKANRPFEMLYPEDNPLKSNDSPISKLESSLEQLTMNVSYGNLDNISHIGDTLYWKNEQDRCLRLIKFSNNASGKNNEQNPSWYLAFGFLSESSLEFEAQTIINARNLLSMRHEIVERLTYDFDNNVLTKFLDMKNKIKVLSNDKIGSHTPFEKIKMHYEDICKQVEKKESILEETKMKALSNSLELIVDALISKLYVLGVFGSIPEQLIDEEKVTVTYAYSSPFKNLSDLLPLINLFSYKRGLDTLSARANIDNEIFEHKIYLADFGTYFWPLIIISLIINSLYHGYKEKENGKWIVKCDVTLKKDASGVPVAISVSNKYSQINKETKTMIVKGQDGITLTAISKLFEQLENLGMPEVDDNQEVETNHNGEKLYYFRIDLPIKIREA